MRYTISSLSELSKAQKSTIKELQEEISSVPKTPEEIKKIVDSYYSYDNMLEKINILNQKIEDISATRQTHQQAHPQIQQFQQKIEKIEPKKPTLREKIVKRLTKNSREYVTRTILSYIKRYESISSTKLKEIIVEDQGLTSKSSFYRVMESIEDMDFIGVMKKGKERHYFYKTVVKQN